MIYIIILIKRTFLNPIVAKNTPPIAVPIKRAELIMAKLNEFAIVKSSSLIILGIIVCLDTVFSELSMPLVKLNKKNIAQFSQLTSNSRKKIQ